MNSLPILIAAILVTALPTMAGVVCEETTDEIIVTRDGHHVLSYQKTVRVPEGVDPKYGRNGFIHPISTPSGRVITDGYPEPHHAHQHGLFFAWRHATFEGETLNFWEHGRDTVRHEKVLEILNEETFAGFHVQLAHVSGDRTILRETWTVKVHADTGHIDLTSAQTCVAESPLTLDQYHYGGMAIRGSRQWFPDAHTSVKKWGATKDEFIAPCTLLTSEGLTQEDGNHSRPNWVCMTGPVDAVPVSITLIPHPTNFRHPQHVRLHPKMPYFCFIPTVDEPFEIAPGDAPWVSRFRIIAEDGEPDAKKLDAAQQAFAGE